MKIHICCQPSIVSCAPSNGRRDSVEEHETYQHRENHFNEIETGLLIHISIHQPDRILVTNNRRMVIWPEREIVHDSMVRMRWKKCEFLGKSSSLWFFLPCMAAAFLRPSPRGRDPSCPGWWRSTGRSSTSPAAASCPTTTMRTGLDSIPSLIRDLRRRTNGTWSLGKGNHRTMTQPANCVN